MPRSNPLPTVSDCGGCGVCCLHMGYPEYIRGPDDQPIEEYWAAMPTELQDELIEYIAQYERPAAGELDGPCVWLDPKSRRCKHHEFRPRVCRDFQVGSKDCLAWREFYHEKLRHR